MNWSKLAPLLLSSAFALAPLAGCGIDPGRDRPLPADHPANPDAREAPWVPPPNPLEGGAPVPRPPKEAPPADHGHHEHGAASPTPPRPYPLKICLVGGEELGAQGPPEVKVYQGREIKFCCAACIAPFEKDPAKYLRLLDEAERKSRGDKPELRPQPGEKK